MEVRDEMLATLLPALLETGDISGEKVALLELEPADLAVPRDGAAFCVDPTFIAFSNSQATFSFRNRAALISA
jgi:hypothetical protein